jgi:two-component system, OmpR family, phosphate regulon sensor histidine kinase PhoR
LLTEIKRPAGGSENPSNLITFLSRIRFMMKHPIVIYKIVAGIAFVVLASVQFFLLFNMYRMEDEHYYAIEKQQLHNVYEPVIRNDKLYPGAVQIIDKHVYKYIDTLGALYSQHQLGAFDSLRQIMCDSMFTELRIKSCGDSLVQAMKKHLGITDSLQYCLLIGNIDFAFEARNYIPIYTRGEKYPLINKAIQDTNGIRISGILKDINSKNTVSSLVVSSPLGRSYKMDFALHIDTPDRLWGVVKKMMPVFLLSLFSILSVLVIFYITFRNWLKQKKLADMQTDFINNITHEFHTPLSAIMVANKSLQNEKITEKKGNVVSLTGVIGRQSDRLKKLIGQVIDVSVGRMVKLNKTTLSLNDLLEDVLLDYRLNISDSSVQLNFEKHTTFDTVAVDVFYFTTMLQNIIDNGIKYNSNSPKMITVSITNTDELVLLSIKDNGIGMTEATTRRIFDKFYRAPNWKKETIQGLGLGLHYARQCVEAHNWKLDVKSKPEEGSEFIIFIPCQR